MAASTTCRLVVALLLLTQTQLSSASTSPLQSPNESEWETIMNADAALNRTNDSYDEHKPSFLRSSSKLDRTTSHDGDDPSSSLQNQRQRKLNPSTGSFKFLVILVQFTDHQDRNLPSVDHIRELCDGTGQSGVNPAGSIADYFAQQSYGKFNIECDVQDWRLTDNTEDFYAQGVRGLVGTLEGQEFFKPVLDEIAAEKIAEDQFYFINLDTFSDDGTVSDGDNNGAIELIVLHSGYAAESSATDCYGRDSNDRIWSQAHIGVGGGWESPGLFTLEVLGYTVASALDPDDGCSGTQGAKMGIIAHEIFHTFRAFDLYDPNELSLPGGVGGFDIMASPSGQGSDLAYPGSASPYTKIRASWLEPIPITEDGVYEIESSDNSDMVYVIEEKYPTDEYLLIENRQATGWDLDLKGDGGLVIYHIDELANKQNRNGFPGQEDWPQNGNHFAVSVVQADGNYDIERAINDGDGGDLYLEGMSLGPGDGSTYPNTDSYQGGSITSTGITITVLSASGPTMSFRVDGLNPAPTFGTNPTPTPPAPTPTPPAPTPTPPTFGTDPTPTPPAPTPTPPTPSAPTPNPPAPTPTPPTPPTPSAPTPTPPAPTPAPTPTPSAPTPTPPAPTPTPPAPTPTTATPTEDKFADTMEPTSTPGEAPSAACSFATLRPSLLFGALLMMMSL